MAEKKKFICSTQTVNSYGFKVLTKGIQTETFKSNPVGFFNHNRGGSYWNPDQNYRGPVIRWEDIKKEGENLVASPVFDVNDPIGKSLSDKVENDFIRAASIGIRVIETSEDPALMDKGQTMPTITKCELVEISVVDIPSNKTALALYDQEGKQIELTDASLSVALSAGLPQKITLSNHNIMKYNLKAAWVALSAFFGVKHAEGATETEVELSAEKMTELNQKLATLNALQTDKDTLTSEKATLAADKADLEKKLQASQDALTLAQAEVVKLKKPANEPEKPVTDLGDTQNKEVPEKPEPKTDYELKAERRKNIQF